ncbi:hypothetical protein ALC57_12868 [Trachymyrmex cornetzi]|uniref:Uncharacterized protein n=1 Tax=Trachymyrmex cornetzi TaxID=471704 RepID=A0A151J0B0_9HYME|nr:hypothetical protein ALC57_12868 [Trachymyrmex cornetzi]
MLEVPDVPQIRQCFGVEPQRETSTEKLSELVCENNTNLLLSETSTYDEKKTIAFWKDENAVKALINQWKQHQPLFESSVTRNDVVWAKIREKPCLKPIALASNLKKRCHLAVISKNTSSTDTTNDTNNAEDSRVPIKKVKTRMERELEVWTKMVSEENRKRDEAKERRHKELLARQDKAREMYEQFMTKLLDKL